MVVENNNTEKTLQLLHCGWLGYCWTAAMLLMIADVRRRHVMTQKIHRGHSENTFLPNDHLPVSLKVLEQNPQML
jgi:hypothetical protein